MNWLERLDRLLERHREVFKEEYNRIKQANTAQRQLGTSESDTNTRQRSEHNTPTTDPVPVANSYDG